MMGRDSTGNVKLALQFWGVLEIHSPVHSINFFHMFCKIKIFQGINLGNKNVVIT